VEGAFALHDGALPQAAVGVALAREMGIRPYFVEPLTLYYPRRGARIPVMGPTAALGSVKLHPAALVSLNATTDEELIVLPIDQMQTLLGLDNQISGIELRLASNSSLSNQAVTSSTKQDANPSNQAVSPSANRTASPTANNRGLSSSRTGRKFLRELQELLGPDFLVQDRVQQQPALYKMMRYEKLAIYLILLFVVIIIASNIFGSLSMLSIAKRGDMETLRAMGANDRLVRRIFVWEGWLVSLIGLAAGLVVGLALTLAQQHYGFVKMPGGFFLQAYPVVLQPTDILWTALGVAAVGFAISLLAAPHRSVVSN
jgi:ABC-type lipoprotein release transport system permease subunit